jgi:hypothetical protein
LKICSRCNVVKSLNAFDKRKDLKTGYRNYCKICRYKQVRIRLDKISNIAYANKNKKQYKICCVCTILKINLEFHKNKTSKDGHTNICKLCKKDRSLKYNYRLSTKQKQQMYKNQNGLCGYCELPGTFDELFVDHDHNTNINRCLAHSQCNLIEGLVKGRISWIKTITKNIEKGVSKL